MTAEIRNFVDTYKMKALPKMTVKQFIKSHNHEIWRDCPKCGANADLRKTHHCPDCGTQLDPNFK